MISIAAFGVFVPASIRVTTGEQAIGHLVQNTVQLQERLERYKDSLLKTRKDVNRLITHTQIPPSKR